MQHEIVSEFQNPLLVVAGAGTGKTRTLIAKVEYCIQNKIYEPANIMAVTFTNKAASEIRSRLTHIPGGLMVRVGTFHRLCIDIIGYLQRNDILSDNILDHIKLTSILSGSEQLAICRQILNKLCIKNISPQGLCNRIQEIKELDSGIKSYEEQRLFDMYESELSKNHVLDFSDLLLKLVNIWNVNPEILELCRSKVNMLCVDEYQDINDLQFKWIHTLYHSNMHLYCVGDPDQSIYSFRGSNIEHILNFEKHFPKAKILKLEENYRSRPDILHRANSLIRYNKKRIEKKLTTQNSDVASVVHFNQYINDTTEADKIAHKIKDINSESIAILIREKQQSHTIEAALIKNKIQYSLSGLYDILSRLEVKDLLAYIKIVDNPYDTVSFKRAIQSPKRGIGPVAIQKIIDYSESQKLNLIDSTKTLFASNTNAIAFANLIDNISLMDNKYSLDVVMQNIYHKSNYGVNIITSKERILFDWFKTLSYTKSISDYLYSILWQEKVDDNESVQLMTIHSSKGLEFDTVFLPGWEEGIIPHALSSNEDNIEEERRLAYVAITRAKNEVYISCARQRVQHGKLCYQNQSRFINEVFTREIQKQCTRNNPIKNSHDFKTYDIVMHDKFGVGEILECSSEYVRVKFISKTCVVTAHELRIC